MEARNPPAELKAEFGFMLNRLAGKVVVSIEGSPDLDAGGFPVCTATVDFAGTGYDSFFGWVQLVQSSDNDTAGNEFEMDPFFLFKDVSSPYCFFGFKPTLFDAPSRLSKKPIQWLAHSFLAFTPPNSDLFIDLKKREVKFVLGFSWGFDINMQSLVLLRSVERLGASDWDGHLDLFRRKYPTWRFNEA